MMPTYYKDYQDRIFKEVWEKAEESVALAKELYFIGYALPDADIHIRTMLLSALARSSNKIKIFVVDPDLQLEEHYHQFLGDRGQRFIQKKFSDFLETF